MLRTEEIGDLADHLRQEGFHPSLYQILAAQSVVHEASQRDVGLGSLVRLTTLLRPIFSSTPEEQERFEKLYLEWLRARSGRPRAITASTPSTPPPDPPRIHWRMKLAVPCLLIVPALTAWFLWQDLRPREAVGRVVAHNQPVAQAAVRLGEQTVATDKEGTFKLPFKNDDMPLQLLVELKGYLPSQSFVGQTILENRKWFYLSPIEWEVQYQIGDVQLAKETAPVTPPPPPTTQEPPPPKLSLEKLRTIPPPVPAWWQRLSYSTALLTIIPVLLVLAWLLYRFSRRAVLKRQSSRIPPELKQVQVQAGTQRLFPSLSLRYVTQRLRQTRFEESTELDVARTIQLTMNRGGLFTPVFGSKREPSYVALIDRATVADHQANVAAQVVKDLAKGYVLVRQYEFDEQPTMLRKVDPLHARPKQSEGATAVATMLEVMSLGEVTAKFPTSRLLCFADPMTCFDPLSGKIRPWVETLEAWEERFLFTTSTHGRWTQADRILSRRGFHVIPLTHLGLRLFSHLLEQDSPQGESATETTRERRGTYERTPQRWLERHPPAQDVVTKLMADLRQELGSEGILWLAACAVYPEIHWAMTLEWGVRLFGHGSTAEALLPKLTPLIWFRHAFMPDWFRAALYDQLSAQEAERISQELGEIISALNPESGDMLQLKIATPSAAGQQSAPPVGRFSAWFQKFRRKSAIQAMGQAADQGSPMRDFVMLQYLSGKQGKALTPFAPKALLTLLFPKGQPWLGFRPLFLITAAVLISTGFWWWKNPVPAPKPSPIVDIGFLPDSIEVILKRENGQVERWGEREQELVLLESGEESAFTDRLAKVRLRQLTVTDPKGHLELVYLKEGQLRVVSRDDRGELVREPAPAAQVASLHWPAGFDAFLVVAHADVPELVKFNGLESLYRQEIVRRTEGAEEFLRRMKENQPLPKHLGEQRPSGITGKAGVPMEQSGVRGAEPSRSAQQQLERNIQEQLQSQQQEVKQGEVSAPDFSTGKSEPPVQTQQQAMKQPLQEQPAEKLPSRITGKDGAPMPTDSDNPSPPQATDACLPFEVLVNQVYNHPSYPMLKFGFDGEMVLVMQEQGSIPPGMFQLSSFPDGQWVELRDIDQVRLPILVRRRGRNLTAQWVSCGEPTQQQAMKQTDQSQQIQPAGKYPPRITGKDGAPMVLIPAGKFWMGSPAYKGWNNEHPLHQATLDVFYMDKFEVTVARYAEFLRATNRPTPGYWAQVVMSKHMNFPVVGVDWYDATAYCDWVGKRLPTEAQWEKAARGTDGRTYPWGYDPPTARFANFGKTRTTDAYAEGLAPVDSYEAGNSSYGLHHMAGNVREWTADWYDEHYYSKSPERNPKGPSNGYYRVSRGGSFDDEAGHLRSAFRFATDRTQQSDRVGFRCAQDIPK